MTMRRNVWLPDGLDEVEDAACDAVSAGMLIRAALERWFALGPRVDRQDLETALRACDGLTAAGQLVDWARAQARAESAGDDLGDEAGVDADGAGDLVPGPTFCA